MDRCVVKNCNFTPVSNNLFASPDDDQLLKQWQQAVDTTLDFFYVCEKHFTEKDLIIDKNLEDEAVPCLHLNDEIVKLKRDCCGFCLEEMRVKHDIEKELIVLFKEICSYEPVTDFMCGDCKYSLIKYGKFKTAIKKKHEDLRRKTLKRKRAKEVEVELEHPVDFVAVEMIKSEPLEIEEFSSISDEAKPLTAHQNKRKPEMKILTDEKDADDTPKSVSKKDEAGSAKNLLRCFDCGLYFTISDLLTHRLAEHDEEERQPPEKIPKGLQKTPRNLYLIPNTLKRKDEKVFVDCAKCFREFPEDKLEDHIKEAHPIEQLIVACEYCFKEMPESKLAKHIQNDHINPKEKKRWMCHICSKKFALECRLRDHIVFHFPDQWLICDICGITNHCKDRMRLHMKVHRITKNPANQCKICLKSVDPSKAGHSVEHHMEKYHKDGYDCGARVNSETNYYDCPQCGASFMDLYTYRRHDCEKGRFQLRCPDCQMPIKNEEKLKIHRGNQCKLYDRNRKVWFYWKGARFKK